MNASNRNSECKKEDIFVLQTDDEDRANKESNKNLNCNIVAEILNRKENCVSLTESFRENKIHEQLYDDIQNIACQQNARSRDDLPYTNIPDKEICKIGLVPRALILSKMKCIETEDADQRERKSCAFVNEPKDYNRTSENSRDPVSINENAMISGGNLEVDLLSSTNANHSEFLEVNSSPIKTMLSEKETEQTENHRKSGKFIILSRDDDNSADENSREDSVCVIENPMKPEGKLKADKHSCIISEFLKISVQEDTSSPVRNIQCDDTVSLSNNKEKRGKKSKKDIKQMLPAKKKEKFSEPVLSDTSAVYSTFCKETSSACYSSVQEDASFPVRIIQCEDNVSLSNNKEDRGKKRKKNVEQTIPKNKNAKVCVRTLPDTFTDNSTFCEETSSALSSVLKSKYPIKNVQCNTSKSSLNNRKSKKQNKISKLIQRKKRKKELKRSLLLAASTQNLASAEKLMPEIVDSPDQYIKDKENIIYEDITHEESYNGSSNTVNSSKKLRENSLKSKKTPQRCKQKKNKMKKMSALSKEESGLGKVTNTVGKLMPEKLDSPDQNIEGMVTQRITHKESYNCSSNTANSSKKLQEKNSLKSKKTPQRCKQKKNKMKKMNVLSKQESGSCEIINIVGPENVDKEIICITLSDNEDIPNKESDNCSSNIANSSKRQKSIVKSIKKFLKSTEDKHISQWKNIRKKLNILSKQESRLCEVTNTVGKLMPENVDLPDQNIGAGENICVTLPDNEDIADKESDNCSSNIANSSKKQGDNVKLLKKVFFKSWRKWKIKRRQIRRKKTNKANKENEKKQNKMKKGNALSKQTSDHQESRFCEVTKTRDWSNCQKKSKLGNSVLKNPPHHCLRPIVIDGSNVAIAHGLVSGTFSSKGIQLAVDYFLNRGHMQVTAFVPQYRRYNSCERYSCFPTVDQEILEEMAKKQHVVFTPSRRINGNYITSSDKRFILQLASDIGGIIVSNDNYSDLIEENELFKETVNKRLLMFCFVGDVFMVPDDPLGRHGPRLQEFLCIPAENRES